MRLRAVALLLIAMLGGSMIVIAAFIGKTNPEIVNSYSMGSRSSYPQSISEGSQSYWRVNASSSIQNFGNISGYINSLLKYIGRNISLDLKNLNISISRASVNGSLVIIRNSVAYVRDNTTTYMIVIPWRLFDGEKILYLDEALLLKYVNIGDNLVIDALNITLSLSGDMGIMNIYIAIGIQDISSDKSLRIALPISID
ncbi:MAG: hypothetical protein QXE01_00595 [Sulfolobales archaeon]